MYIVHPEYKSVEVENMFYDKEDIHNAFRLMKVLLEEENIIASFEECVNIWQRYSNDLSASWLSFPQNDEVILNLIKSSDYFTTFEEYSK